MNIEQQEERHERIKRAVVKKKCEENYLFFCRYFMQHRESTKFIINWHHRLLAYYLMLVHKGVIKNLIFNVAPGSSKTELAVVDFVSWCLVHNPWCRFLHISYSDDLALTNSQKAKDLVESEEYQELWPLKIAADSKAKKRWNVMAKAKGGKKEKIAGGVYAVSLGGQITGFRAGRMVPGFSGAILIDDPLKPEDALSDAKRKTANRKLISTVKSRKANPNTPIILIMQRLSQDDPTDFIEKGNLGGEWTVVKIPAMIDDEYVKTLPKWVRKHVDSKDKVPYAAQDQEEGEPPPPTEMKFSYWPYKEPIRDLIQMSKGGADKDGARMSRTVFSGQMQQNPTAPGGNIIQGRWFIRYRVLPKMIYRAIFADTAMKEKEHNDYSVFQCWGHGIDGKIYLLDQIRGKWPAHVLKQNAIAFWAKHKALDDDDMMGSLRIMRVEDKSSGTGLIQDLSVDSEAGVMIEAIPRHTDKLIRVNDAEPYIHQGLVCIPEISSYTNDFIKEFEEFTADDTHEYDDQIDPTCDAVKDMISSGSILNQWGKLG